MQTHLNVLELSKEIAVPETTVRRMIEDRIITPDGATGSSHIFAVCRVPELKAAALALGKRCLKEAL